MTHSQILATIRMCAQKLGRIPTRAEGSKAGLPASQVRKHFAGWIDACRQAGLDLCSQGYPLTEEELLLDWAAVVRKLGKLPTTVQYENHGRYHCGSFHRRWGRWHQVPHAFRKRARQLDSLRGHWADVLARVEAHLDDPEWRAKEEKLKLRDDRAVYGAALTLPGLAHEPMDESGVIFLFGIVAHRLGFTVLRTQSAFPDCEALREFRRGQWQRVTIEFEFESRNFLKHGHRAQDCDIILCWRHNWPEVPKNLEVIELSKVVRTLGSSHH